MTQLSGATTAPVLYRASPAAQWLLAGTVTKQQHVWCWATKWPRATVKELLQRLGSRLCSCAAAAAARGTAEAFLLLLLLVLLTWWMLWQQYCSNAARYTVTTAATSQHPPLLLFRKGRRSSHACPLRADRAPTGQQLLVTDCITVCCAIRCSTADTSRRTWEHLRRRATLWRCVPAHQLRHRRRRRQQRGEWRLWLYIGCHHRHRLCR
jgi:hypothetical protein